LQGGVTLIAMFALTGTLGRCVRGAVPPWARPILARPSMAAHAGLRAARMVARDAAFLAERMGNLDSPAKKGVLDE
jgi:hypothetical protein